MCQAKLFPGSRLAVHHLSSFSFRLSVAVPHLLHLLHPADRGVLNQRRRRPGASLPDPEPGGGGGVTRRAAHRAHACFNDLRSRAAV